MNVKSVAKTKSKVFYIEQRREDLFILRDEFGKLVAMDYDVRQLVAKHVGINSIYCSYEFYKSCKTKGAA